MWENDYFKQLREKEGRVEMIKTKEEVKQVMVKELSVAEVSRKDDDSAHLTCIIDTERWNVNCSRVSSCSHCIFSIVNNENLIILSREKDNE